MYNNAVVENLKKNDKKGFLFFCKDILVVHSGILVVMYL